MSLPRSVRHSYDGKRLSLCLPGDADISSNGGLDTGADSNAEPDIPPSAVSGLRQGRTSDELFPRLRQEETKDDNDNDKEEQPPQGSRPNTAATQDRSFGLVFDNTGPTKQDKGKGKATPAGSMASPPDADERPGEAGRSFSKDLERGPDILGPHGHAGEESQNRNSTVSMPDGMGIGSAISSSNSSIMGDPEAQPDMGEEWGPQHPCFPHRNPHVPVDDPEYITTRIIRIRRDWLIRGDLAPTFSNLYPEILDPAGMNEPEFRRVIDKLNSDLTVAFEPWSARNVLDGVLGLVTGWLWEDFGLTGAKARLARLERWIEAWNVEMARTADEGAPVPPKIIPLRQTGYMTVRRDFFLLLSQQRL